MKYKLCIDCVDGETFHHFVSQDKKEVLKRLAAWDHEGSTLLLEIETSISEEVYRLLD